MYRLNQKHYVGIRTLLKWSVSSYSASKNKLDKEKWRDRITLLAAIQKEQFYNHEQRECLNTIRKEYLLKDYNLPTIVY